MSIAKHHTEWLSLLEISGPFLSMPVLLEAFPHGLDADDPAHVRELRAAYEEWADNQGGLQPDPAIHTAWVRYVLMHTLEFPDTVLAEGQGIPTGLQTAVLEHHETIRPDILIHDPATQQPRLLIQVYPARQGLEKALPGHNWQASPATRMMELLRATEIRLGLVTNGEQWLLVQTKRGETTGYVSWYAPLWLEERLTWRAFRSLLGVHRFFGVPDGQTLPALLDTSAKDQHEVTDQLGYQVRRAVEILVQAIDQADQDRGRSLLYDVSAERLYEAALTVMMRLVFLLTAEERGLLLLGDPLYDQHYAVSTLRAQLRETADLHGEELLERRYDAWCRLLATFRAVYGGIYHENLHLPPYGGSLFHPDRFPFLEGRRNLSPGRQDAKEEENHSGFAPSHEPPLPIHNRTVLHLLDALQMLQVKVPGGGPAQARRLSFRALDIEQIGHVYEGLLDHVAVRATEPVIGLQGTRDKEPEIALSRLEEFISRQDAEAQRKENQNLGDFAPSRETFFDFLKEQTGRSESALKKAWQEGQQIAENPSRFTSHVSRLRIACGNDETLYRRVLPWAGLIREDDYGYPVVVPAGSVYVTAGATRRATGTHYTPRSLTEPIVQHTLEPLVYSGPAEGWPREQWQLRTPAELLSLKICDMAMGSGAFLVQADRYLAERLVEAWESVSSEQWTVNSQQSTVHRSLPTVYSPLITPEGQPTDDPDKAIPADAEERLRLARRLVADRCLYGVDKNPLAVEMAKLSLWLVTLDKNRPFTFLDHALKHGDSLVGADEQMFLRWSESLRGTVGPLYYEENEKDMALARQKRRALQAFTVRDVRDAEEKARLLAEAETALARVKRGCDLLVGVRLLGLNQSEQETWLAELLIEHTAREELTSEKAQQTLAAARQVDAFHWPFEFPEVFANGGFSAFVGNPPFLGGLRISTTLGDNYLRYLRFAFPSSRGTADLCAMFFLRAFELLQINGTVALIATNTIAQGDTREAGLEQIVKNGGTIFIADSSKEWPGVASVYISIVHIINGQYLGKKILDENPAPVISPLLDSVSTLGNPRPLAQNANKGFIGSFVLGMGFTMKPGEAQELIRKNAKNARVLFPYFVGEDLNSSINQSPSRWVINFFDWPLEKAEEYTDLINIVREKVYPERQQNNNKQRREIWWRFTRPTIDLYKAIASLKRVLVCSRVTKYLSFAFVPANWVYADRLVVFTFEGNASFSVLQSSLHEAWARKYSSTLETRLMYAPSDCLETFPFLRVINSKFQQLEYIGETYHKYRQHLMLKLQEGLTATYNRFHDPAETSADIARLRELHVEMDNAVAAAYGWGDLELGHRFHQTPQGLRYTLSEPARREVLARLLRLNHERHAEELKLGLHEKKKKSTLSRKGSKGRKKKEVQKKKDGQLSLF